MHNESIDCTTCRLDVDETFVQRFNPGSAVLEEFADSLRGLDHLIDDPPGCAQKHPAVYDTYPILYNRSQRLASPRQSFAALQRIVERSRPCP
jgi:hypothetical protein